MKKKMLIIHVLLSIVITTMNAMDRSLSLQQLQDHTVERTNSDEQGLLSSDQIQAFLRDGTIPAVRKVLSPIKMCRVESNLIESPVINQEAFLYPTILDQSDVENYQIMGNKSENVLNDQNYESNSFSSSSFMPIKSGQTQEESRSKVIACPIHLCGMIFSKKSILGEHLKNRHIFAIPNEYFDGKNYICPDCGEKWKKERCFAKHLAQKKIIKGIIPKSKTSDYYTPKKIQQKAASSSHSLPDLIEKRNIASSSMEKPFNSSSPDGRSRKILQTHLIKCPHAVCNGISVKRSEIALHVAQHIASIMPDDSKSNNNNKE